MWTASSAIPRKLREKSDSEEKSHSTKGEVYEKKNKTNTSSMYLYDVIIIVAFATNSNGKKYRKIQNHISGSYLIHIILKI